MIDLLAANDLVGFRQRAQERKAAITDVIACRPVVHEADHLEAELPVLQDLVGNHASEVPGAGNQHALQADAGLPAALECLADDLAREIGQRHVDEDEQAPHALRDFVRAGILRCIREVVGAVIERAADPEHDRQHGADKHREEVVHPGSSAAQPVNTLEVEGGRDDGPDDRQQGQVLAEGRDSFRHRQARVEANPIGDQERRHRQHRVADDVEGDEEAVVAAHHVAWLRLT